MPLTNGIHHVAIVTADLDRWIAFYVDVFGAEVMGDMTDDGLRHAMVDVGGATALHAFEAADNPWSDSLPPMFDRGHADHVALHVTSAAVFEDLRRRLADRGASDGAVTDFGSVRSISFVDPDGWEGEIAMWQDGATLPFAQRRREPLVAGA